MLLLNPKAKFQTPGIPWVYEYREHEGLEYMFMERLGHSLNHIAEKSPGRKVSNQDVLMIGIQAVRRLRDLHENGILHRDVKPENFAMGIGQNSERTVYIIDFGLAIIVKNWVTYECDREVGFAGSYYHASTEALFHKAPTRKGDLESLLYMLLYLAYGELPWKFNHPETGRRLLDSELGMQRLQSESATLCRWFPEMTDFFDAVKSTRRTEKPDYERLINLLEQALHELNAVNDAKFAWLKPRAGVKPAPLLSSQHPNEADEELQIVSDTSVENTKADPVTSPGFGFKLPQNQNENLDIRIEPLTANICCAEGIDHTVDGKLVHRLTPVQSVQHGASNVSIPAHVIQNNRDCNRSPVSNLIHHAPGTSCLVLAERQTYESEMLDTKTASESSKICFRTQRCDSPNDVTYLLCSTISMACYLACRDHRTSPKDVAQQRMDDKSFKSQRSEAKKEANERDVSKGRRYEEEAETQSEMQNSLKAKQTMTQTQGNKCRDHEAIIREQVAHLQDSDCPCSVTGKVFGVDTPIEGAESRRGRKRAFIRKIVSSGIGRALQVMRVSASVLLRRSELKS